MSRVGILTFNFALNYGSLLQCYALQTAIEELGHEAHVVRLIEDNSEAHLSNKKRLRNKLISLVSEMNFIPIIHDRNTKVDKFRRFAESDFHYTTECRTRDDLQEIANGLDVLVCGSDQVWNTRLQDFTELFFLPISGVKKIGYSISTGAVTGEEITNYRNYIEKFDAISVREKKTQDIVKKLCGKETVLTTDPTFLAGRKTWEKMAEKSSYDISEPYVLCFLFGKNREYFDRKYEIINRIAKEKRLKVVYLNHGYYKHSFKKNAICDGGIEDFLKLIKNASVVITDSFHGTAFSLIFEKDFYSIVIGSSSDRRKQELLTYVGADERLVDICDKNYALNIKEINYEFVGQQLKVMKDFSLGFLSNELL